MPALARELACAALGWAIAAVVWVGASGLQRSLLSDEFGAEGMPKGLAIALALVSTLIAARALIRRPAPVEAGRACEHLRPIGILAIGFGYVILAPWTGYVPAAFLLLAATTLYFGARPTPTLFAVSLAGSLFLWWMFAKMLAISMPSPAWMRLLG